MYGQIPGEYYGFFSIPGRMDPGNQGQGKSGRNDRKIPAVDKMMQEHEIMMIWLAVDVFFDAFPRRDRSVNGCVLQISS